MPQLKGLEGVAVKDRDCENFETSAEIKSILDRGLAATTADVNGAVNIWLDDEGYFRCECQRYMRRISERKYKVFQNVINWADTWLENIKS